MSKISWTDETWNPLVGCSKVSPGCDNCYAEKMACRLAHMGIRAYQDVTKGDKNNWFKRWNGKIALQESQLDKPLHWKKPRKIFVCSMSDLFHENIWAKDFETVLNMAASANTADHTFLFLTKRPERMKALFEWWCKIQYASRSFQEVMNTIGRNWWIGVTAENQEQADKRIPILLQIPAAVRFVSLEPLLTPVAIKPFYGHFPDWIICGGEAGPGARPMHPDWPRSIRDQCQAAGVPFHFKQWGEYLPTFMVEDETKYPNKIINGTIMCKVGKKKAGRLLDSKLWDQYPTLT